jgi:hypothetical protein
LIIGKTREQPNGEMKRTCLNISPDICRVGDFYFVPPGGPWSLNDFPDGTWHMIETIGQIQGVRYQNYRVARAFPHIPPHMSRVAFDVELWFETAIWRRLMEEHRNNNPELFKHQPQAFPPSHPPIKQ